MIFILCFRADAAVEDDDEMVDGMAPTPKRRKLARDNGLQKAKSTGRYPVFGGVVGPVDQLDPSVTPCLDFVKLLWPDSLCEYIAKQTNLYARQCGAKGWSATNSAELWVFLGIVLEMGIHRLPEITDYWSKDPLLGVQSVSNVMSLKRFQSLWRYLHCEDNTSITDARKVTSKLKTVLETLKANYFMRYNPSQELSVDEMMIQYKGRKSGKIHMPKKPVKLAFKVWCCSCSCCGYLCVFDVYSGKLTDSSGKKIAVKGLVKNVVHRLLTPFYGHQHVVYMDNFYTSGPLIEELAKQNVFTVGTILKNAAGFPASLKDVVLDKGDYTSMTVGDISYSMFNDRRVVSFATNVFPDHMPHTVMRMHKDGTLRSQSAPPCLPAYNMYMGGVDNTGRMRKTYGYDRKCRRYWFRIFFQFLDVSVNNAYILYRHNCVRVGSKAMPLKGFRLELIHSLLGVPRTRSSASGLASLNIVFPPSQGARVSANSVGVSRGRCQVCVREKIPSREQQHTAMACPHCRIRICKGHSVIGHTCAS